MTSFRRFVAIGDSSTEGLEDPDGYGGYRGWADRLAEIIANAQTAQLGYANLGVRGLHLNEIRTTQLDSALEMRPDLLSIFGGANDLLSVECDFGLLTADLASIFGEARSQDCTVVTFTMPDPSSVNPFGRRLRRRMLLLNDIIRAEAERYGVLVMDFQNFPIVEDPRLFSEDRLHGNELGHERVAAAMAWRLGITGSDLSWAEPFTDALPKLRTREQLAEDLQWARRYFAPWLGRGIRGIPHDVGRTAKRPVLTPVPKKQS
ncbi:MAG TPA: SGNH/GDSL hydrolase family protein [Microlunatus sp.]|jgi:lysophospholipase L1-like esterase|nr:SGNH/GDSL hydrolase family protein [Microlunatus sp.]